MHAEWKKVCIFAAPEPAKPLNDAQMCGSFSFYTKRLLVHKLGSRNHSGGKLAVFGDKLVVF